MSKHRHYKWRLYADNNIEKEIIDHLRDEVEMDVLWVRDDPAYRQQQDDSFHYQKARQLKRYLLTHDDDFWDDRQYPIRTCPGLILLPKNAESMAKYFPQLLSNMTRDYGTPDNPVYLDGVKIRLTWESITIKMMSRDTQQKTTETWTWKDLGYKR
jgi:hypothetical protein